MTFREAFEGALLSILKTGALFELAILSVVFYAFYYPLPYAHQVSENIPMVVVDEDRTGLSATLVQRLGDTRAVEITGVVPDFATARRAVRAGEADGILYLSPDFSQAALYGRPDTGVAVWVNGAYLVRAESISEALTGVVEDTVMERLQARTPSFRTVSDPIVVQPLFNTTSGYLNYIFPAIVNIILQQTLLFTSARLIIGRLNARPSMSAAEALGTWAGCTTLGIFAACFYFGFVFWFQDVPRAGNMPALLIAVPLFAMAVAALGLLVGTFFRSGEDVLKLLMPTSVPLVFLAGFAWPLYQMPDWLATLVWLSPATVGMHLFVRLNQMGATLQEVAGPLLVGAGLALGYGSLFLWRMSRIRREAGRAG